MGALQIMTSTLRDQLPYGLCSPMAVAHSARQLVRGAHYTQNGTPCKCYLRRVI